MEESGFSSVLGDAMVFKSGYTAEGDGSAGHVP